MAVALLSSAYFGPVQWYQKLYRHATVLIEQHDSFVKQTYRNRCVIATANGPQTLTVPVTRHGDGIRVSDHGNWRHVHWQALVSAYGESPFFDYYADDLLPLFTEPQPLLYDLNLAITRRVCQLLDLHTDIRLTTRYRHAAAGATAGTAAACPAAAADKTVAAGEAAATHRGDVTTIDYREVIHPKHPLPDADFVPRRYYQVYERRHGFLPNLSILDLLFNMGPESVLYL